MELTVDDSQALRRYSQHGDVHAFEAVVERHQAQCLRVAWALLRDAHGAQDVVQEVFMRCCEDAGRLLEQGLPRGLAPWLMTVTRNRCIDRLRKQRLVPCSELCEAAAQEQGPQLPEGLWSAIDRLSPLHGAAVLLRYREELSYREIAEHMGKSVSHIGVLLHEALNQLRQDPALRAEVMA